MIKPSRSGQFGFSLLEVLVAFSILSLSLGVLMRIFSGDGRLAGMAEDHSRAIVVAESLLANAGVETPLHPGEFSGQFDQQFSWTLRVTPFIQPDVAQQEQQPFKPYWVELTVEWGENRESRSFTLSTLRIVGENQNRQPTGFGPR